MKKISVYFFVVVSSILLSFSLSDTPLDRIIAGFQKYLDELPQEKVYLHFDRPYYASGDTIWFKAYITTGAFHLKSSLSRTVYIELINEKGGLVEQLTLLSIDGSAPGDISLSDTLKSGNYLIRAYTNWMKNTGEDYFFHRYVKIWNASALPVITSPPKETLSVQFFPEGGELVNGILSKVAFKAVASDGFGRQTNGKIVDETGATVCEFKSNVLGMGSFNLTPIKGKTYTAVVDDNQSKVLLPTAKESGLTMSIRNSQTSADIILRIETRDASHLKNVYVLGQTRGVVCYAARTDLSAPVVHAKIAKTKFPAGIAQITVIDQDGIPLAERLVYVEESAPLSIEIKTNKQIYAPRELVTVQINAKDSIGRPTVADLSLSIVDDSQVITDQNQETISSYLLVSSELKGFIESPGYYFNPLNKDRWDALDNLLLTQGWRRLSLKKAQEAHWQQPAYKVEKGLTIEGRMLEENSRKPVADGKVTYIAANLVPATNSVRTNSTGDFKINDIIYFDSAQVVFQGETKKGIKFVQFAIDNQINYPSIHFPLLSLTGSQTALESNFIVKSEERRNIDKEFNFGEKVIKLKEVEIKGKKEEPLNSVASMYGKGTASLQVGGNPALENQLHPALLLQGRVAGVEVRATGSDYLISIRGGGTPMVMIDDIPVSLDNLNALSVNDIERVEVWKGADAAFFGMRGGNGVIGFYTKRGGGSNIKTHGVLSLTKMGYQLEREFYSPVYDLKKPEDIKPDKRVTLYWAPMIRTDSLGRASVSFYNHDVESNITGVIEGLSVGKPVTATFKYAIRKN